MKPDEPKRLRILTIGAHPADVFDQSGGTMAHHTARGDWVGCVVLTHGARIHDKVISDEMFRREKLPDADELNRLIAERGDVKSQEVVSACKLIGVTDVFFFGADDAILRPTDENVRQLARAIRKLKPDIVITHFPRETGGFGNPHAAAGEIVMLAMNLASGVDPGDRNPPHRVAQTYFFGAGAASVRSHLGGADGGFTNDVFIDITDVAHLKVACLDALESQGYGGAYARKRIETNDGAFGTHARCAYAEGFIRFKSEVAYYLPVCDLTLKTARMSDHEQLRQMSQRLDPSKIPEILKHEPARAD